MIDKSTNFKVLVLSFLMLFSAPISAKTILVYGDSLSAAYGMQPEEGWAWLLQEELGQEYQVINASISGETASGGLLRLPVSLEEFEPDVILIELGANDGLRGLPISSIKDNLNQMISLSQSKGVETVLFGISLPANRGPRYIDKFRAIYTDLAATHQIPLFDLYREEFIGQEGYVQEDGLHPTAITQPIVKDLILEFLVKENIVAE